MRKKYLVLAGVAALLLCTAWFVWQGTRPQVAVPPIFQLPPRGLAGTSRGAGVYLQAWAALPNDGVVVSVINDAKTAFEFDARTVCDLSGLAAVAVDTDGKPHPMELAQFLPAGPGWMPASGDRGMLAGFERVAVGPGESFSWPVRIVSEAMLSSEMLRRPYTTDHWEIVLTLKEGGELRSNPFAAQKAVVLTRPVGAATKTEFTQRLDGFRWNLRGDMGLRVATLFSLAAMQRQGTLSAEQFAQVLAAAPEDASPLVRAHAAAFPAAWKTLLLDGDPRVRLEAVKAAGGPMAQRHMMELMPILLAKVQDGDAATKIAALKALAKHTGGLIGRQFEETIARAKRDADPEVAKAAKECFAWLDAWPVEKALAGSR